MELRILVIFIATVEIANVIVSAIALLVEKDVSVVVAVVGVVVAMVDVFGKIVTGVAE